MKAILLPIKPKWCALMMNGYKTIEVRKENVGKAVQKLIDKYGFADIYVYCSKDDKNILFFQSTNYGDDSEAYYDIAPLKYLSVEKEEILNGKVIFKFRCYKVEEIKFTEIVWRGTKEMPALQVLLNKSCLSPEEIITYLKGKDGKGYAIHISELEIFDKPKELSEFQGTCKGCAAIKFCKLDRNKCDRHIKKAPQSMCYVEVER